MGPTATTGRFTGAVLASAGRSIAGASGPSSPGWPRIFSVGQPRGAESALGILWIPDLISVTSISLSFDNGDTYKELAETDYIPAVSEDFDKVFSYNTIILDVNGNYSSFPVGQRSVKITGVWGYTDDREDSWEDSGLTISAELDETETTLSLVDADAQDRYGLGVACRWDA